LTLGNDLIQYNNATNGGGIYNATGRTVDDICDSPNTITGNNATGTSGTGGGVYNNGTVNFLYDDTISGNSAAANGGGVYTNGTFTMTGGALNYNQAQNGGGLFNAGTITLTNLTVGDNLANQGGGLYLFIASSNTLTTVTVSGNQLEGNNPSAAGIALSKQNKLYNPTNVTDNDDPNGQPVMF
jgi:predicted outer membrane repeat protein